MALLKKMLTALAEKFTDTWDAALPWVLFAYHEVPVEILGCSPFDLLFGRSIAGLLALLKSAWLHKTDIGTAKQTCEFTLKTCEKLRSGVESANKIAAQKCTNAKTGYDK